MRSRTKNFRRRAGDVDVDDEDDDKDSPSTTTTTPAVKGFSSKPSSSSSTTAPKPKKTQNQAPKLLSFAEDEGNDEVPSRRSSKPSNSSKSSSSSRLGKPSSSHRMTSFKDRLSQSSSASPSIPSNVQPQAGTYTKEALLELQKNTRTLASSSRPSSEPKPSSSSSSEPIIVLKGLVKPSNRISETVAEAEDLDSEDDDDDMKKGAAEHDAAEARLASMAIGKGRDRDMDSSSSGFVILSQADIDAIRAKKERMRQSRAAAPDYISLDAGSNHGAAEGLSDEEPEFRNRIAIFGEKMDGIKKGVFEDFDEREMDVGLRKDSSEVDDDDDDDDKIWEEEQVRKGLGTRRDDGSNRVVVSTGGVQPPQNFMHPTTARPVQTVSSSSPSIGGAIGASQGLSIISQNARIAWKTLGDCTKKLQVMECCSFKLLRAKLILKSNSRTFPFSYQSF